MSLWFVVVEDAAYPRHDLAFFLRERTDSSTLRTGLLLAQFAGLLPGRYLQGAGQQRPHGRHRHLFHLRQRHVKAGALLAPVLPHDDFPPALRQFLDPANIL
jgi:hypothetical protein